VQDIGRVAVLNAIWEHRGPLGSDARMQVRLHAYHSEQILSRCAPLRPLAAVAGLHHHRLETAPRRAPWVDQLGLLQQLGAIS
jgi:HD-GYP domain-containing protein (c-di-GMP phosphodiesterase class II)